MLTAITISYGLTQTVPPLWLAIGYTSSMLAVAGFLGWYLDRGYLTSFIARM